MKPNRACVSLAMCALMVLGGFGNILHLAAADTEPNNDIASAELISPGTHSGLLNVPNNPNDLLDCYKFNVTAGQIIGFDLRCGNLESGGVKYTMYRPNGTQYQASNLLAPGESQQLSWMTNNSGAGQWYVRMEGPNNYSFDLSFADQDDAPVAGDAGDDLKTPRAIEPNDTYSGQEGDDDIADFYSFQAKAGQSLQLGGEIFSGPKNGNMTLYGIDKQALGSIDLGDPDASPVALILKATGTYFIGVEAGNCQYLLNLTLKGGDVPDIRIPSITITSPINGTTVGNASSDLKGTASDDIGVASVEVSLSGIAWWTANGTATWSYPNLTIGEGINTIYARATDYFGKQNITWVTVAYVPGGANDTERPQVLVTSPTNGTTLNVSSFDLSGTAADDFGVFKVEVSLSGIAWWVATGTLNWTYPGLTIGEGISSIWVKATDFAGRSTLIWVELAYVPGGANDTMKPNVTFTSPTTGTVSNNSAIDLTGTASDDFGVFKVEVSLNGIAWLLARGTDSWSYSSLRIGAGGNTVYVKAMDFANNSNVTSVLVIHNPGKAGDTIRPTLSILGPKNDALLTKDKLTIVSGLASDNIAILDVGLKVNGVSVPVSYESGIWTATNITLKEGRNTFAATATDYAGNTQTASVSVTYEKPKPQPGFEAPFLLAVLAAAAVLLARKKNS